MDLLSNPIYNTTTLGELFIILFFFLSGTIIMRELLRIGKNIREVGIVEYTKTESFKLASKYIPFVRN